MAVFFQNEPRFFSEGRKERGNKNNSRISRELRFGNGFEDEIRSVPRFFRGDFRVSKRRIECDMKLFTRLSAHETRDPGMFPTGEIASVLAFIFSGCMGEVESTYSTL